MEKSNLKNLKIKTKLKALALSAVTLVTGISCGKSNEVKAPEQESSIIMEAETNTKPNKNTIESTVDNMIKEKETKESKENDYVENYNYYEENNYVEDETNLETTETKIENKTEAPSKIYEEEIVIPKKGASITPSTNHTTTKIKNSDIKVTTTKAHTQHPTTTKKVTTTQKHTTVKVTTTKPITTTVKVTEPPVVTQPPRTDYNKYDLLDSDPAVAAMAFEKLSSELRDELYSYYIVRGEWGVTNGADQARIILAVLNYNQDISPEALASDEALGKFSKEDLVRNRAAINLPYSQCLYQNRVDFSKYVIDDEFANRLNQITNEYFDWRNGNGDALNSTLSDYFKQENYRNPESITNAVKFYIWGEVENGIEGYEEDEVMDNYLKESALDPLYERYEPYKGRSYTR